ncbi:hypothetical protein FACS1894219_09110 [Clostridia bacterium]|nr:hypothetical protein FACS1894219_09110 [Clostridia bacterium]
MRNIKKSTLTAVILSLLICVGGASSAAMAAGTNSEAVPDTTVFDSAPAQDSTDSSVIPKDKIKGEKTRGKTKSGTKSGHGAGVNVISVAADVLGITAEEVEESVRTGKVGDLLVAADKVEEFKSAYLTELKSKLDSAVTGGTLTQEEADEKYAAEKVKIDAYDGTSHLCGKDDHSGWGEKKVKSAKTDDIQGV